MGHVSLLGTSDQLELERFLLAHANSSVFLRSNVRNGGMIDQGQPLQATYVAMRDGETITAVAAHCWNGVLLVQGRIDDVPAVTLAAVEESGRAVAGFSGPYAQVAIAREALGMRERPARLDSKEDLFALALDQLCVPPQLAGGAWQCRRKAAEDIPEMTRWGVAYAVESLGTAESGELERETKRQMETSQSKWVLVVNGQRVAMSGFNAQLPDTVQVGGVYTPPSLRGRGYARAVVAGSLLEARSDGVTHSILFTENKSARAAYLSLGYKVVGDYGLVLF
jgi:predicted GNAT family acetyltransferase